MKVLAIIPAEWGNEPGCVVALSKEEWALITRGTWYSSGEKERPRVGMEIEICKRTQAVFDLEETVKSATKTPDTLRGMASALEAVVNHAAMSITRPITDIFPNPEPEKK